MIIPAMRNDFQKRFEEDDVFYLTYSDPSKTDNEFQYILFLCAKGVPIGYGALDSFLSGPDIEQRVRLVESETKHNETLRCELADTLNLNQSKDWSRDQHQRLCAAAGIQAIYDITKKEN